MLMLMLWSAPRGRSTAFYRMMMERGDFTGVFEPFSHIAVFGNTEISGRPLATAPEVIAELRSLAATRQVFIKDTTDKRYPEALADRRFLAEDAQHTFLIRHPRETIRSYLALSPNARIHEFGFEAQYEVYTEVRRLTGRDPLVVDAGDLMNRPADTVKAYCAHVGIDFRPHALSWQPSGRPEWQRFRYWFTDVAASSGLAGMPSRRSPDADQHPMLGTYLAYHLPFYQKLYQRRLVVLGNSGMTRGGRCKPPARATRILLPDTGVPASFRVWTTMPSPVTLPVVLGSYREWRLSPSAGRGPRARTGRTATGISRSTTEVTLTRRRCVTSAGPVRSPRSAAGVRACSTAGRGWRSTDAGLMCTTVTWTSLTARSTRRAKAGSASSR
jgi:Sulfotransferase domain